MNFKTALIAASLLALSSVVSAQNNDNGRRWLIGKDIKRMWSKKTKKRSFSFDRRDTAVIYYDSTGSFGWAGELYGVQLSNLLTHFGYQITYKPIEQYKAGELAKADAGFYLGFVYDNALPTAFKTDVTNYRKPFCWMGFNLWQIAWDGGVYQAHNASFVSRKGFRFMGLDEGGYPTVRYKGVDLVKEQYGKVQGRVELTDTTKAYAAALSLRNEIETIPYIVKGGDNFWYVGDNPLIDISLKTLQDRMLAFSDLLHDILKEPHTNDHRAIMRIEDVSPIVPAANIKAIADVCDQENVPFTISVIPEYRDPFGVEHGGVPTFLSMDDAPEFIKALKYAEKRGGQIMMHGVTHQYDPAPNPYSGVSGPDFEFFRVAFDDLGRMSPIGVIPEDNLVWLKNRLAYGKKLFKRSGFDPEGWVTPHYMASEDDYEEFANQFEYSLCRGLTFSTSSTGEVFYLTQFSPFTYKDQYGTKRIPETLGYYDEFGFADQLPTTAEDMRARAHANYVVRDGWAGHYFHWFYNAERLREIVRAIKAEGYDYVKAGDKAFRYNFN